MARHYKVAAQQLAGKNEAAIGVAETLAAADVNLRPEGSIQISKNFNRFANDELSDDIGQSPDFVSGKAAGISFGCIFKGSGVVGTPPAIGPYLRACGLKEEIVRSITIGTITGGGGSFAEGATYSATGGKTGWIDATISAAGSLKYIPNQGGQLNSGDVITVGAASATASTNSSLYAVKYSPRSVGHETMTLQRGIRAIDGVATKDRLFRIRGALGNATISATALDTLRIQCQLQGALAYAGLGDLFTPVDYETISVASLAKFRNVPIQLNGVEVCPENVSFALGNTVDLTPDPCTDGGDAGYSYAVISRRAPVISMNPYTIDQSVLDEIGLESTGNEIPISMVFGTTPNVIEIRALKAQIRSAGPGERGGQETWDGALHIVRNGITDGDYGIYFR